MQRPGSCKEFNVAETERRIDVVIFRACLAHSVPEAWRTAVYRSVQLNGNEVRGSLLARAVRSRDICFQKHRARKMRLNLKYIPFVLRHQGLEGDGDVSLRSVAYALYASPET